MSAPAIKAIKTMLRTRPVWEVLGYTQYAVMGDGSVVCADCVAGNFKAIVTDTNDECHHSGWCAAGTAVNWEDAGLWCCNCDRRIPSAYAEDEVPYVSR